MTDIKPCPFCGTVPDFLDVASGTQSYRHIVMVTCETCGASGPVIDSVSHDGVAMDEESEANDKNAFEAWNRRAG